jgi:hypothetical protein
MKLNDKIKQTLEKIHFGSRYKKLSESFQFKENYTTVSNDDVLGIINSIGHVALYEKKGNFYKLIDEFSTYKVQLNISLKYGNVELIWGFWTNEIPVLDISGPWGLIYRMVMNMEERILMPKYRNCTDLHEILKEAFSIYEDFKREVIREYNNEK